MNERPIPPPANAEDYGVEALPAGEPNGQAGEEDIVLYGATKPWTAPEDIVADFTDAVPPVENRADPNLPRLKTAKEFVADFTPPDYLIDGILQRGYFYTLTAKTGHGKTAWGLLAGICTAAGIKLGERECRQGNVCFFAGENADDVRARLIATLDHLDHNISQQLREDG